MAIIYLKDHNYTTTPELSTSINYYSRICHESNEVTDSNIYMHDSYE